MMLQSVLVYIVTKEELYGALTLYRKKTKKQHGKKIPMKV